MLCSIVCGYIYLTVTCNWYQGVFIGLMEIKRGKSELIPSVVCLWGATEERSLQGAVQCKPRAGHTLLLA